MNMEVCFEPPRARNLAVPVVICLSGKTQRSISVLTILSTAMFTAQLGTGPHLSRVPLTIGVVCGFWLEWLLPRRLGLFTKPVNSRRSPSKKITT